MYNRLFRKASRTNQTSQHKRHAQKRRRNRMGISRLLNMEPLEDRRMLASFSEAGNVLSIDLSANEQVTIRNSGADYSLELNGTTWSGNNNVNASGNTLASLTVTAAGLAAFDTINIVDSGDGVSVVFDDSGAATYADSFNITLDAPAAGSIVFVGTNAFVGTAAINASTTRDILLIDNGGIADGLSTVDGGITLSANAAGTTTGNFIGIDVNNVSIASSGSGSLSLTGSGGDDALTGSHNGVQLQNGASVRSTGTGPNAGTITINGTGGTGTDFNAGVYLEGINTDVTSVDGAISITGTGGNGSGNSNAGVRFEDIERVASIGTGANAAIVTISGTGGTGTDFNGGVVLTGISTDVTSVDGAISITGTGGDGSGISNAGVSFQNIETVASTGTGANAAIVTINGTGGTGTDLNAGVVLTGISTDVTSVDGAISITGTGGDASGNGNAGVRFQDIETIASTGTGATAATVTINGTGGTGTDFNDGVTLTGISTDVTSVNGAISITGTGGDGSGNSNAGVAFQGIETISSTGTGADAATITIEGTGGSGTDFNHGVFFVNVTTDVTSVDGAISISGTGGDASGFSNVGVLMGNIETIASTGTGVTAARITITGTGGTGTDSNIGVVVIGIDSDVTSVDGAIEITGTGGSGSANDNDGVLIDMDAAVQVTNATLTVRGTASAGDSAGVGLSETDGGQLRSLGAGAINVTGTGSGLRSDLVAGADSVIGGITAAGPLTINADSVDFSGTLNVQSSGDLTIQPRTPGTAINLGGGVANNGLQLDATELAFLTDGFASINLGDANSGTGAVVIENAIFSDPVAIYGSSITVDNGLAGDGGTTLITLDAATSGQNININSGTVSDASAGVMIIAGDDFTLASGATIDASVGPISINVDQTPDADVGVGSTVILDGTINTPSVITVTGGNDADTFTPSASASFDIIGGDPATNPGDTLNIVGLFEPISLRDGSVNYGNSSSTFSGIENMIVSNTSGITVVGDVTNDNLSLRAHPTLPNNAILLLNGGPEVTFDTTVTTGVDFIGGDGDDTLTVDFSDGVFTTNINFDGGLNLSNNPGDQLVLVGPAPLPVNQMTFNYTNANDGLVDIDGVAVINYTGLEPITSTITATNVTLNYSAASETITAIDAGGGSTTVDSTLGELTTFLNPTDNLTINTGGGADAVVIDGLNMTLAGALSITDPSGPIDDAVTFSNNPTTISGGVIDVSVPFVDVLADVSAGGFTAGVNSGAGSVTLAANVSGGGQTYNEPVTLSGDTVLTSSDGIDFLFEVDGANTLSLDATADGIRFLAAVGSTVPLTSLTVTGNVRTLVSGDIITTGDQSFETPIITNAGGGLINIVSNAGTLAFDSTIDNGSGPADSLRTDSDGETTFGAAIGNSDALASLDVSPAEDLLISNDITVLGDINITISDFGNLTIQSPAVLTSGNINLVNLDIADNIDVQTGSTINTSTLNVTADPSATDADPGTGSTILVNGTINATNVTNVTGGDDADTISITPQLGTSFQVDGGAPVTQPGDSLTIDAGGMDVTIDAATGAITIAGTQPFVANNIENFRLSNVATLTIAGSISGDVVQIAADSNQVGDDLLNINGMPQLAISSVGSLIYNGSDGDDLLTFDATAGLPTTPVTFNGQGQDLSIGGDQIVIQNGTVTDLVLNYANANDGSIQLDAGTLITYTGLEPITSTITAANVTLNYSSSAESIDVTQSGTDITVNSTAGESTTFAAPTNRFMINTGGGADTIIIDGLNVTLADEFAINDAGPDDDLVVFANSPSTISTGGLNVQIAQIQINADLNVGGITTIGLGAPGSLVELGANITSTDTVIFNSPVSLTAASSIAANNEVTFGGTVNGSQDLTVGAVVDGVRFMDAVGDTNSLASLTITPSIATTQIFADISTSGDQSYGSPVQTSPNGGLITLASGLSTVTFLSTLDNFGAPGAVLISSEFETSFGDDVGSIQPIDDLTVVMSGDLVITNDITVVNSLDITAGDGAGDLVVQSPAVIATNATGSIRFNIEDDVDIQAGSTITTANLDIIVDNADLVSVDPGVGSSVSVLGTLNVSTLTTITGAADADTFNILPQIGSAFSVVGGDPTTSPGDSMNLDAGGADVTIDASGQITIAGTAPISTIGIEDLTISNVDVLTVTGDSTNETMTLAPNLSIPGQDFLSFAGVTYRISNINQLVFDGGDGDDTFVFDASTSMPTTPVTFNGQGQDLSIGGDQITVLGSFTTQTLTYTAPSIDGNDGTIDLDGTVITYTGLEPINAGNSVDTILNFNTGASNNATLRNSANPGEIEIVDNGATFEDTILPNPTNSLTINLGDQGDILAVNALDAAFAASLIINGGIGTDDVLRLDFADGNPIPASGVTFDGGVDGNDSMEIVNGSASTVTHTFFNANDGSVDIDGAVITYVELEPILDNLDAVDRVFDFQGGSETISLGADPNKIGANLIDSTLGEVVSFTNPSRSLTINSGDGDDVINITTLDAGNLSSLIVNGGAGALDTLNMDGVNLDTDGQGRGLTLSELEIIDINTGTISNNSANLAGGLGGGILIENSTSGTTTTATIDSVMISGNTASFGGGVYASGVNLTIEDATTISGNSVTVDGGGVYIDGGSVMIFSTTIDGNRADESGGGVYVDSGALTLTSSIISNNQALGADSGGGGVYLLGSGITSPAFTISNTGFASNTARSGGGGLEIVDNPGTISLGIYELNSVTGGILQNQGGGAIVLLAGSSLTSPAISISGVTLRQNSAPTGGGLAAVNPNLTLDSVLIENNSTIDVGGGFPTEGVGGGIAAIGDDQGGSITILNSKIQNNTAVSDAGGIGVADVDLSLTDTTITSNGFSVAVGGRAGGIGIQGVQRTPVLTANRVTIDNNVSTGDGGGVALLGAGLDFTNVTISDNDSGAAGGGIAYDNNDGSVIRSIRFSTITSNTAAVAGSNVVAIGSPIDVTGTIFNDGETAAAGVLNSLGGNLDSGNTSGLNQPTDQINTDPLLGLLQNNGGPIFTHALLSGSPAIDSGPASGPATDARGAARPIDGDNNGSALFDIGAYEGEAAFVLIVDDVTVNEDAGTATITVRISSAVPGGFTVNYTTEDITANQPSDYQFATGTLTFAGTSNERQTFTVNIVNDDVVEPTETARIRLLNPSNATVLASDTGLLTITDNDIATLTVNDVTVNEGAGTATVSVTVDNAVQSGFTVDFATVDGTAIQPGDYTAAAGTLTFVGTAGETQTFTVSIVNDTLVEPSEFFTITLSNASNNLVDITDTAAITILDNDVPTPFLITGHVYCDANRTGAEEPGEALDKVRVFADSNGNRQFDGGELEAMTDSQGNYQFATIPQGDYTLVAEIPPTCAVIPANPGVVQTLLDVGNLARSIKAVDRDGDGDKDLVIASDLDGSLQTLINESGDLIVGQKMSLGPRLQKIAVPRNSLDTPSMIAVVGIGSGGTDSPGSVYFGSDTFTSAQTGNGPIDVLLDDFNGDGINEILTASFRSSSLQLISPSGLFAPRNIETSTTQLLSISSGDVDGDGDIDIIAGGYGYGSAESSGVVSSGDSEINVLLNDGFGNFTPAKSNGAPLRGKFVSIKTVDIDNDGVFEIAAISRGAENDSSSLIIYTLSNGTLVQASSLAIPAKASAFDFGDLDGDSLKDVVVASEAENRVVFYRALGNGNFQQLQSVENIPSPTDLTLVDIDGDGRDEVAVANLYRRQASPGDTSPYLPSTVTLLRLTTAQQGVLVEQDPVIADFAFGSATMTRRLDVNVDTRITAGDALQVINELNLQPASSVKKSEGESASPRVWKATDVNLDGLTTPRDALLIINYLNRQPGIIASGESNAMGEMTQSSIPMIEDDKENDRLSSIDEVFAGGLF